MLEREIKLAAPPGFSLPDLARVGDSIAAGGPVTRRLDTTYFDTRDLRLTRWGASLRYRKGEGWTAKLPGTQEFDDGLVVRGEHAFEGSATEPPTKALDLLTAYLRRSAIHPVARLRTKRTLIGLRSSDGTPLVEAAHDDVAVLDGKKIAKRFFEVEVELRDDASEALVDAILERLRAAGAGEPNALSKVARALGPRAQRAPEIEVEELAPDASAGAVLRRALAVATVRLMRHDAGVRLGSDIEDVHQARVAVRRLRSHLRTFLPLMEIEWATSLRQELGWLADELGSVRDADVLMQRLRKHAEGLAPADRRAGAKVIAMLAEQRQAAMSQLLSAIHETRYVELLKRLVDAARSPQLAPIAAESGLLTLPPLVASLWRNVHGFAEELDEHASDDQLHKLRIRAKRCRYAAEAVAPVAGKRARNFARAAAEVQAVLGEHHDAVVATLWLRDHAAHGPLTYVGGQFAGLELRSAATSRLRWPEAWRAFDRKKLRTWM